MPCKRCQIRGQTWDGAPPVCAFDLEFCENWNCATLGAIRQICDLEDNPGVTTGSDHDDQHYAMIDISRCADGAIGLALWVTWYKSRGKTDGIWVMSCRNAPRQPSEEELEAIICAYKVYFTDSEPCAETQPAMSQQTKSALGKLAWFGNKV